MAFLLALPLCSASCKSADAYRAEADEEVYAMVLERREELFGESGNFSIAPAEGSLRQRILSGEWESGPALGLVDCLEIAAENSRLIQSQREILYRSALDLSLERWRYSFQFFGDASATANGSGDEASDVTLDGSVGFTRFLGTGASIVTSLGSNLFRVVSGGNPWSEAVNLSLSITQPLMRGAGRAIALEPLTQAERNLVYAVRNYERFRRTYAVDVARRVYGLLQSTDEVKNEERNYQDLVALSERNSTLAAAGRMSDIQAAEALQRELDSEDRLISLRAGLAREWDQFNLFLGLPIGVELQLDPSEFEGLVESDPSLDQLDETVSVAYALDNRLDYLTACDRVDDSRRRLVIAEDALRAGLSMNVAGSPPSDGGDLQDFRFQDTDWTASLALDLPIDRLPERNAMRSSQITLATDERNLGQDQDSIRASVRDALRAVREAEMSTRIQKGAVVSARRRLDGTKLTLEAGRVDTVTLLDAQADLVRAENSATASLIQFNLARLDLHLELETLRVDEGGIHVHPDLLQEPLE